MSGTSGMKGKFKSRATTILKSKPKSMKDFLNEKDDSLPYDSITSDIDAQIHSCTNPQKHISTVNYDHEKVDGNNNSEIARIHVHIKKELADKMIDLVFKRKRNQEGIAT